MRLTGSWIASPVGITVAARLCGLRSWGDAGGQGEGGAFVFVNRRISAESSIMMIHGRITVMESESEVVLRWASLCRSLKIGLGIGERRCPLGEQANEMRGKWR